MTQPVITVVVPYHNEGELLHRALHSILTPRSAERSEVVVVDDHSDLRPTVPVEFADRVQVVRSERSLHAAGARNLGILLATGEYVAFLDADDVFESGRLESHASFLDNHPECAVVGAPAYLHQRGTVRLTVPRLIAEHFPQLARTGGLLPADARHLLFDELPFRTGAMTARRADLTAIGGFDERWRWGEEGDLVVRLAQRGRIGFVPHPAMRYLMREGSISTTQNAEKHRSAATMYREWRAKYTPSLLCSPTLRLMEREAWLLAGQLYLEAEDNPLAALSCSLRSLQTGISMWGIRSALRGALRMVFRSRRGSRSTPPRAATAHG